MSQGFNPVNLPHQDEAPVESLTITSYKAENMEDNVGDAGATETAGQASMAPATSSNTPKKRSPKNAKANTDGTPAPKTPRKNAKAKETNEDGTPVAKATPGRKKALPKLDDDGNRIAKTPRKKADPKPKVGPNGEPLPKTPRKSAAKKVKSDDKVVDNESGDMDMAGDVVTNMVGDMVTAKVPSYGDEDTAANMPYYAPTPNGGCSPASIVEEPTTPKGKKSSLAATGTPGGKKKRAVDEDGEYDAFTTPTKKIKAATGTPKSVNGKGMAIATSKEQLSDEDKMLIQWKKDGKSWAEIRKKWTEITGKATGNSTLPNRYTRLMANITDWKDGDLERMILAEKAVTKAFATELYSRMASAMVQLGADTYSAAAIEKAYLKEKREGFPHAATIDQVINGASTPAIEDGDMQVVNGDANLTSDDEGVKAIDQVTGGSAAPAANNKAMEEDAETPDEGNSDGGVPISPGQAFNSQEGDQAGVGAFIKGEDSPVDSDMA
ncbi:hypothetical protein V496_00660 [Pseudogymnoascus sp. VKM F-4515 (FW-2607)]|nr:hypothetical protein V496_00660 [Pseudogymnoascus sp. VKM F-4515 (FW-2607)]